MNTERSKTPSGRFEKSLRTLLKQTHSPVEAKPEFKDALLQRLKEKQQVLAVARKRRHRIITLTSGMVAAAAAVVMAFTLQLSGTTPAAHPANTPEPDTRVALVTERPSEVRGAVMIEATAAGHIFTTAQGQSGAVEVQPGTWLVMQGSSRVSSKDNTLEIDHGQILVDVSSDAAPAHMLLAGHAVDIPAGTRLTVQYKPSELYAPGGRPAPLMTLMAGAAQMVHADEAQVLSAGETYSLYPTVARAIRQDIPAEEAALRNVDRVLVHYTGH